MIIDASIERLLQYAQSHLLLDDLDVVYKRNVLLDLLGLKEYTVYEVEYDAIDAMETPDEVLSPIISYALEKGIIQPGQEEYFGNKVMDIVSLTPISSMSCTKALPPRHSTGFMITASKTTISRLPELQKTSTGKQSPPKVSWKSQSIFPSPKRTIRTPQSLSEQSRPVIPLA